MLLPFADFRASIRVQSVSTLESRRLHLSLGAFVDTLDVLDGFDQAAPCHAWSPRKSPCLARLLATTDDAAVSADQVIVQS